MYNKEFFVFAEATELLKQRSAYQFKENLSDLIDLSRSKNKILTRTILLEDCIIKAKIALLEGNNDKIDEVLDFLQLLYKTAFTPEYTLIYVEKGNFLDYVEFRNKRIQFDHIIGA